MASEHSAFAEYGCSDGPLLVYFHGAPGAPQEAAVFDLPAKQYGLRVISFERFTAPAGLSTESSFLALAAAIEREAAGRPVVLVGFSIGAFAAVQTCRYMTSRVSALHLISAAAPLESGDFLPHMAGKAVFQLARNQPRLFVLLSYWQSLLARWLPTALFRLIFASAQGADKPLAATPAFQAEIKQLLQHSFGRGLAGYMRDVRAYAQPWQQSLAEISVTTHIWHGSADNWSPPAMADCLAQHLPKAERTILPGLSHYSCLQAVAERICQQLEDK